jgi:diguanylate cyclase (GGDEF)-like protein
MASILKRQISFAASILFSLLLTALIVRYLSGLKNTVTPEIYLIRTAAALTGFFFPILGGWISFSLAGGAVFAFFASVMVFFVMSVSSSSVFVWFLMEYAAVCYILHRMDRYYEDQSAGIQVDREKYQNEKNDLGVAHKLKGEGISILFEKYSTYYNLRKLAEELATSLAVSQLADIIVKSCFDFINRGDLTLLNLADADGQHFSAVAFRQSPRAGTQKNVVRSQGDLFDFWVVKNQRRLIVSNAQQDFRFDVKEAARLEDIRSLIIAPLVHERRAIGTLRVNSAKPEAFSNDDLRLLDTITVLASSALSNAMLFEQTEELAIKDSLTGLFVRRYFFDRLKEEHRRALLTQRPLSLLMCDLDHFKDCNDRYGHGAGDLMLIQFAQILRKTAENAIVSRYGGEEFSVLIPEASKEEAAKLAEEIRMKVEQYPFMIRRERILMTVSIGVANLPVDTLDVESLIQKADQALYQAKREGRNRVCSSAS